MRILIASSLVLTLAATSVFLACSSDDSTSNGATPDGGTSTTSSSGTSGASSSGDGGGTGINSPASLEFAALDGGCSVAPATVTCKLHCTGYQSPTVTKSTPRADAPGGAGIAWTDTDNAKAQDTQYATVVLNEGEESASLDVSGYGFAVPATDSTYGIAVEFARESDGAMLDAHFTLMVDNPHPNLPVDHMDQSVWPTTQDGVHHYGQCLDTWQLDLSPGDVNTATFGARVSVKRAPNAGTGPITAKVDSMRANVCYCNADGT